MKKILPLFALAAAFLCDKAQAQDEASADALVFFKQKFPSYADMEFVGFYDSLDGVWTCLSKSTVETDAAVTIMGLEKEPQDGPRLRKFTADEIAVVNINAPDPDNRHYRGVLMAGFQQDGGYVRVTSYSEYHPGVPSWAESEKRFKTEHSFICYSEKVGEFFGIIAPFVPEGPKRRKDGLANNR